MKNQKKLIILTGPSGVGKGTVVKEILGKEKNFWLSISATTGADLTNFVFKILNIVFWKVF